MKLQLAGEQDIDEIEALMRRTEQQMENPEWFVADDRDFIRRHIEEEGRTVIARSDSSRLAGFFILRFPGAAEDNLSRDIPGIACRPEEAVHMESAAVDPAFRGQGLQRAMAAYGERIAAAMGFQFAFATVHPDNRASLTSMQRQGFDIAATKEKYGGRLRHILIKRL